MRYSVAYRWMHKYAEQLVWEQVSNWYSVNFTMAQQRANNGAPTIAITDDHIAIVRPNDGAVPADVGKVRITQAGAKCYNDTTLSYGWGKDRRDEVKFYSWYTDEELK